MSMAGAFPSPFASLPGNTPSPFNAAMPGAGHTAQMPRADRMNIGVRPPSSTPPPPAPARQSAGAARSPRDANTGGGSGSEGGNGSSEGWPPAASVAQAAPVVRAARAQAAPTAQTAPVRRAARLPQAPSADVFASPAVLAAQQRPVLEPLPIAQHEVDADDKPTVVVEGLFFPPEARAESGESHLAVSTGEFAILDEPTPLLGAPSLGPEAFRDDAV
ncbi:MAG: hypothetical protein MUF34_22215, partial [Polyangiaceae bacterium]|nr:hypothetical protein [Polyangiaceae bacterium]